jgi:hypothetical protein
VLNAPQPRYKIVEQGRRLVTIDTTDGKRIGTDGDQKQRASLTWPPLSPLRRAANQPEIQNKSGEKSNRPTKIVALSAGAIIFLAFLILSGAWIPMVVALMIAPVRTLILTALRTAVHRYMGGS